MQLKSIESPMGHIVSGRDAVYVDSIEQKSNTLIFRGEINSRFCQPEYRNYKWYAFQIVLKNVKVYKCENIDVYPDKEWHCDSPFS